MPAAPATAQLDPVYAKTAVGRAEVALRGMGLNSRQRTLLILVDGRKTQHALDSLMPGGQVEAVLAQLAALGLVAPAGADLPAPARQASARLDPIKHQMRSSAETCLGLMAAELVRRIERAADDAKLLSVLGHWHMAMRDSKRGRDVVEDCLARIKAGFQDLPALEALTE